MNHWQNFIPQKHLDLAMAAIGNEEKALSAWKRWKDSVGDWAESQVDTASYRLLPCVYKNFSSRKIESESLPMLHGLYKKNLINNLRFLHHSKQGLQGLHQAGIPILAFKGLNLALNIYKDKAARSMSDLDILVRDEDAEKSLQILLKNNWQPVHVKDPVRMIQHHKSVDLIRSNGGGIDLHRRFLQENGLSSMEMVWERAKPSLFDGIPLMVPSDEDELLLACVHGWRWNIVVPVRWLVDAHMILEISRNTFDWKYLVETARMRKVSFRTVKALSLLSEFSPHVPREVVDELSSGPFEEFEAAEEKWAVVPDGIVLRPRLFVIGFIHIREFGRPRRIREWIHLIHFILTDRDVPFNQHFFGWVAEKLKNMARRYKLFRQIR